MFIKVFWQYLLPQHFLTWILGRLAHTKITWLKNFLIDIFVKYYAVDLREAREKNPHAYPSFRDFFVRELTESARPIATGVNRAISPVDGKISQIGLIDGTTLIQAKKFNFDLRSLLACDENLAEEFRDGSFATIYLSPRDYHCVHAPLAGTLKKMVYVPGKLFAVNACTTEGVPNLFARNERVINVFMTEKGSMAVIMVGALIVGGVETAWAGKVAPSLNRQIKATDYSGEFSFEKGGYLGCFSFGSTVIVLFSKGVIDWRKDLRADTLIKMGEGMTI
jgi:phosphatidylserine decarboxylase